MTAERRTCFSLVSVILAFSAGCVVDSPTLDEAEMQIAQDLAALGFMYDQANMYDEPGVVVGFDSKRTPRTRVSPLCSKDDSLGFGFPSPKRMPYKDIDAKEMSATLSSLQTATGDSLAKYGVASVTVSDFQIRNATTQTLFPSTYIDGKRNRTSGCFMAIDDAKNKKMMTPYYIQTILRGDLTFTVAAVAINQFTAEMKRDIEEKLGVSVTITGLNSALIRIAKVDVPWAYKIYTD